MPYTYSQQELGMLRQFADGTADAYPLLNSTRVPIVDPNNEWSTNPFMEEGPMPMFRDRNAAQFNTDNHLPWNLFKPNRSAVLTEDLIGAPLPVQPEPYGNKNFAGTLRNYVALADKTRGAHGAYNGYLPPMNVGESYPTVWEGFGNGFEQTERRRRAYNLVQVPFHPGVLQRGKVPLQSPMCHVWPNRDRFYSNTFAFPGSIYNPASADSADAAACVVNVNGNDYEAYTHAGVGERRYRKNEGVGEVNARFEAYRPEWHGYQWVPNEGGHVTSVMRPTNKQLMEEGIRWTGNKKFIYPDDPQ